MADNRKYFDRRLARLNKRHGAMSRGMVANMQKDGLIVVQPRKIQFKLPLRGFVILMALLMMFKGFVLAHLGEAAYFDRIAALQQGSLFEQAGAFIMGIDPVSHLIADVLRPLIA